jgi:3-oxoacyl-[acyl-carrier protein] reductase
MTQDTRTRDTSPALVTGGSKGIGAATCAALARQGHPVTFCYGSDEAGAANTVATIEAAGGKALAVRADVSDAADVGRLFT